MCGRHLSNRELKKLMESRMVQVEMSEAEVLIIHALATMSDGRNSLTKIFRKRISPVAMKILENRREYHYEKVRSDAVHT